MDEHPEMAETIIKIRINREYNVLLFML